MITTKRINRTTWTAITTAGQQGTCWMYENIKGEGGVFISHSNTGSLPRIRIGFRVWKPNDNTNICLLGPDDLNDIFYARCLNASEEVKLCVDVI
ncbi:hypothetical protein LCGC14_0502880 [marine sediment metagenome]|uniref:Uncharacterized protein n=1 Tax=marine sediment metagenome TaxID=412755 RepID=A0A0F9S3F7_9ZZZZ